MTGNLAAPDRIANKKEEGGTRTPSECSSPRKPTKKRRLEILDDMPDIVKKHTEQRIRRQLTKDLEIEGQLNSEYRNEMY